MIEDDNSNSPSNEDDIKAMCQNVDGIIEETSEADLPSNDVALDLNNIPEENVAVEDRADEVVT